MLSIKKKRYFSRKLKFKKNIFKKNEKPILYYKCIIVLTNIYSNPNIYDKYINYIIINYIALL